MSTDFARMSTPGQVGMLHGLFRGLHVTDRTERMERVSRYIGRDVSSLKDLSQDEAGACIEWLQRGGT